MGVNSQLNTVLNDQSFNALLNAHISKYVPGMSASEFISSISAPTVANMTMRMSITAGYYLGKKIGLRSKTVEKLSANAPVPVSVMSIMCGMAASGISPPKVIVAEDESFVVLVSAIPSSPLHMAGEFEAQIFPTQGGSEITITIVYSGQMFAWGAGSRLFDRLSRSFSEVLEPARKAFLSISAKMPN